ncbi:hypothetical protein SAMN06297144_2943 [Sphingomonas guangdongensis]|jgi:hypothetical protein|uniref:Uncharacterized protein n=1 Tax=Sphingomonas guangdongensis TaxID=1141890 RepID=A0A285R120_9SPHN|nr:hypothetical protein [Sphingomonas guangdongensis]SOB87806.1 hypothetical protein SAMN06297144_2943 [Sphingomonas guangdongensis]
MKYRSRLLGSGTGTGAFGAFAQAARRTPAVVDANGRALSPCCAAGTCDGDAHQ